MWDEVCDFANWNNLPRFLLCDESAGTDDDRIFVLHTRTPRFLMEFRDDTEGTFFLIDPPTADLAKIKDAARRFFGGAIE